MDVYQTALRGLVSDWWDKISPKALKRAEAIAKPIEARAEESESEDALGDYSGLAEAPDFVNKIDAAAEAIGKHSDREFKRIGIKLSKSDPGVSKLIPSFRKDNVALVKSMLESEQKTLAQLLADGAGRRVESLKSDIEDRFGITSSHAELIARDQTLKLNADVSHERMQRAGITQFVWTTAGDERVRPMHDDLDGETFDFDSPPVTNEDGDTNLPGEDFQCRCVSFAVVEELDGDDSDESDDASALAADWLAAKNYMKAISKKSAANARDSGWVFRAQHTGGTVFDLDIYDVVDPNAFTDPFYGSYGVSARQVLDQLKAAQDVSQINVRINSAGGDVFDGMAIYNLLHSHPARVRVQVDGLCASIASIIAMAGDEIVMGEGTWMMVHKPYSAFTQGSGADDLRKTADVLDKMTESMCAVYASRTGQSAEDCEAAMDAETWMTAEEAKSLGYCTEITPANAPEDTETEESKAIAQTLLKTFARVPAGAFLAMARAHGDMQMNIQANAATRIPASASAEKPDKMADDLAQAKKDLDSAKSEVEEAKKAKKDAEDALADFKKKNDDEESSAGGDKDGKKAEALALARLGITARALTGAKTLPEAEAAIVALAAKNDKLERLDAEMSVMRTERHQARVSALIAEGKLRPSRKDWALAATPAALDAFIEASGGEVIVPIAQEHKQPAVPAVVNGKGVITAQDREIGKHLAMTEEQLQQAADLRAQKFGV